MCHLVIIDDDPIQHIIVKKLIALNPEVSRYQCYLSAAEALDVLAGNHDNPRELPDVILLDLKMGTVDGQSFLEIYDSMCAGMRKESKVIIVSSMENDDERKRLNKFKSVKGFYPKPLTPEVFKTVLQN